MGDGHVFVIQRKVGKSWVRARSVWTNNDNGYNYGICFKAKRGTYRAHVGTFYPYNTVPFRAHSANSKTIALC